MVCAEFTTSLTHADSRRDARNPRGTVKHGIKKEDSDSDDNGREPQHYIAQPLYEEQKDQGMFYHPAYVNPGDLKLEEGADFDFNDFPPFPSFGTEEPVFPMDMSYNVNNFETFLDDATGGYGMIPNGTRHGAVELDADGIPIINDNELPEGVVAQQGDNDAEVPSINGHVDYNAFFMSDYSNASSSPASSEDIPLSKRPIADILENGVYVEDDTRQRVLAYLCMARDQMADQGIDNKQFISCIGQYARILAKTLDSDVKPTIDAEGLALEPNPATLS